MKTYPLLQSQMGVLLQSMQHPQSTQYNLPNYIFMPVSMTRERVIATLQRLMDSIPELHTRFVIDGQGEMRQWCDLSMSIPIVSRKCSEEELTAYIRKGFVRPFDPFGDEPLFRVEVVETEKNVCLLSDGYHAIVDGMSFAPILTSAFVTLFEGGSLEPQSYGLYQAAEEEAASFGTPLYQRAKEYYAKKFDELEMVTLSNCQPGTVGRMGRCTARIGQRACDDWCSAHGVQPNLLFQAAFGYVMAVLARKETVAYAAVNHGRMDKRLRSSVGMFVKSVPMSVNADPAQKTIDFIRSQRAELMSSIRYGIYPFTHFCSDLQKKPGITFNFQAVGNMEERLMIGENELTAVQPLRGEVDSDLGVLIFLRGDAYEICAESSLAMNSSRTLQMVAEAMRVAVGQMMAHPELTLGELDIVSADERAALIALGRGPQMDLDASMTFVKAFEQCARQHPDRLALADAHDSLTYREVSARSNVLARRLLACGVRPNDFVAVKLDRTVQFPLAVIAIHKAGAAYVPIDSDYPEQRQQLMLEDAQAKVVIDSDFLAAIDFSEEAAPVDLSAPDGLAYMIYTSGSTGTPKGAMLHQAGLWNFINVVIDMEHLTADDRICGHRSFSFDAHVEDLFPVLTLGGSFHVMPSGIRKDLSAIYHFLLEHQITGGGYTTGMAKLLLDTYPEMPVRFITAGGEKLDDVFSDHVEIINVYGPTECTVDTAYYRIVPGCRMTHIPIGQTVANCWNFITDVRGRLLPRGAAGELCFAGVQVGAGYWRQPELTAEKFIDCPFLPVDSEGKPIRMYRTGDLCRWNEDGQLEYLGRIDNQVKLRGFRIELGEIEACAHRFEGIGQAVAVVRPVGGNDVLCLYFTADRDIDVADLRAYLSQSLANHMVPAVYMQVKAIPLTPNGKVDRRRLPDVDASQLHVDYVAPQSELERRLVAAFEQVLGQEPISVHDDFMHLGGDSLSAVKLVAILGQQGITVADVLSLRTPAAIAENAKKISVNLNRYSLESGCPLNNIQMFMFDDIVKFGKYDSYLIPSIIPIDRKYTDEQIKRALDAMFTAHPVLTMHVEMRDGVPYMVRGEKPTVMRGSLNPLKLIKMLTGDFDLYSSLSRHVIFRIPGKCYLLSIFHHLIFDTISNNVFYRHFQQALEGTPLDFVDDHFLKVAAFNQEVKSTEQYAEMDKYIRNMLSHIDEAGFYRNAGKRGRPGYHARKLGIGREQVETFTKRFGINKNILFTAAMAMTLSKLTAHDKVAFGFLNNGRDRFDNFEDIGLYITGMPLVTEVDHHDMQAFLNHQRDVYYELSQNSFFPFASLVQEFNISPIIIFQFFPDWIDEDGKYDHLPQNETLVNAALSTQKDFMVEAMADVFETKDGYEVKIYYSGYYSRKMIKALAATYKETIAQMLQS